MNERREGKMRYKGGGEGENKEERGKSITLIAPLYTGKEMGRREKANVKRSTVGGGGGEKDVAFMERGKEEME